MNTLIGHLCGGGVLAVLAAGCSHPLDVPSIRPTRSATTTYLGHTLPVHTEQGVAEDAPALPPLGQDASLQACLSYAAWSSPTLEAAFHRWRAALARVPQVSSLPDPQLNYGYFIESIQTRTGPMQQQVALSQQFPWWGLLDARADAATAAASSLWHEYEFARLQLFERVTRAWTAAVDLQSELSLTQDSMQLLEESESIARTAYEADRMPHHTLLQLQIELGILEDRIARLRSMVVPRHTTLNAAMGRPPAAKMLLPTHIHDAQSTITLDQARSMLGANHPKLKALDDTIAQYATAARVAELSGLPQWAISISTIDLGDAADPSLTDSGRDPVLASVGLTLPIWRDKYDGAKLEAHANRLEAAANRSALLDRMHAELTEAVFQRDDSIARIKRYTKALLPRAEDAAMVSSSALAAGTGSATDVLDAQRTLLELQRTLEKSRAEAINSEATIATLLGGSLEITQ